MTVHYLQHVPFEGPGALQAWCAERGHALTATRLFAELLPARLEADLLVVLGGPMNIYEEERYPWLAAEKSFLRQAIAGGARVLGICLGAQLLADVLGGSVSRNPEPEIGWYPVESTAEAKGCTGFRDLPGRFPALHWHGDTFGIPEGAVHLARSEACAHQAFAWDRGRVLGVQFHLEETRESLGLLVEHAAHELAAPAGTAPAGRTSAAPTPQPSRRWVSTAEELLSPDAPFAASQALLFALLDGMMGHLCE